MRPTFVTLLLALATSVNLVWTPQARASIVLGPISYVGHDYYLISKNSWVDAEAEAVTLGGHLVTIQDAAENTFLVDNFVLPDYAGNPLWIGLNDVAAEGTFVWSSGAPVVYTNWYLPTGEPNNFGSNEDYGTINWHFASGDTSDHGTWNDTPLNGTAGFSGTTNGPYFGVVETPEPSTFALAAMAALCGGYWWHRRCRGK